MKTEIMEVTPALARKWLATNTANRSVRRTVVARYQSDMERGAWDLNGEAIILNGDRVLDGQHRLLACIEAGRPFQSVVVTDAPEGAMKTIDQGLSRSLKDVLKWKGYSNESHLSGAVRSGFRWDRGTLLDPIYPTIDDCLGWLDANPGIASATAFVSRVAHAPINLRVSIAAPVYLKASEVDHEAAAEFFDRVLDGEHIAHGDPVYSLRRILITNAIRTNLKMPANTMMAFTIKAWNAWIMREPLKMISWKRGGQKQERFPVMLDSSGNPISAEQ